MSLFVLDASATLPAAFEDESSEYSDSILEALARDDEALVPPIWATEVTNALRVAELRGRIEGDDVRRFLVDLETYPITAIPISLAEVRRAVLTMARRTSLTIYDSSYLFLAVTRGVPIASEDERMIEAADRPGVAQFRR